MAGKSSEDLPAVLVTGASGFIGGALVELLLQEAYPVSVLLRDPARIQSSSWANSVSIHQGDITRSEQLATACSNIQVVIHCAGYAHNTGGEGRLHQEVNLQGTLNLLEAAIVAKARYFIYLSSSKAESRDSGPYGQAKLAAENALLEAHWKGQIKVCCLRPSAVYGQGMKGNLMGWIRMIRKGIAPPLPPVSTRIAMIDRDDLCRAVVVALQSSAVWGKRYSLSDGIPYRIKEIEGRLRSMSGRPPSTFHFPQWLFKLAATAGEISRSIPAFNIPFGRSGYNTLFFDEYAEDTAFHADTGFTAQRNFYVELPSILQDP